MALRTMAPASMTTPGMTTESSTREAFAHGAADGNDGMLHGAVDLRAFRHESVDNLGLFVDVGGGSAEFRA